MLSKLQLAGLALRVLQGDRNVELYPYQTNSWWYVGFNQKHPALADLRTDW